MLIAHGAFWLLLLWAKKDDEIEWGEAIGYAVVWSLAFGLSYANIINPVFSIVATVALDIILLFRTGLMSAGAGRI